MEILYDKPEISTDYMSYGHDLTPSSFSDDMGAAFSESFARAPMMAFGRMYEMSYAELDEDSPDMTSEEWKESPYYREGLTFPDGVNESVARITADRKDDERQRQDVINRAPSGLVRSGSRLAVEFGAQMADPLNIASAFVPVVGHNRFMSWAATMGGPTKARIVTGAVEGVVGATMIEPIVYAASKQEQADYGMYESLTAVVAGAVLGSALHTGLGKVGDILGISPYARQKAFEASVGTTVRDRVNGADRVIKAAEPLPMDSEPVRQGEAPDTNIYYTWDDFRAENPDVLDKGILRSNHKPYGAKGDIPKNLHDLQGLWQNYGQYDEIPANKLFGKNADENYIGIDGKELRGEDGVVLFDRIDADGDTVSPIISNEQLKNILLKEFSTPEGKKYLKEVIEALPKNPDGTITAFRVGELGEGIQSFTLSRGMAKTFSQQGTDIPPAGMPGLPKTGYDEIGALPGNVVKIDPEGIVGWSPYDKEILVKADAIQTKARLGKDIKVDTDQPQHFTADYEEGEAMARNVGEVDKSIDNIDKNIAEDVKFNQEILNDTMDRVATPDEVLAHNTQLRAIDREAAVFDEYVDRLIEC